MVETINFGNKEIVLYYSENFRYRENTIVAKSSGKNLNNYEIAEGVAMSYLLMNAQCQKPNRELSKIILTERKVESDLNGQNIKVSLEGAAIFK